MAKPPETNCQTVLPASKFKTDSVSATQASPAASAKEDEPLSGRPLRLKECQEKQETSFLIHGGIPQNNNITITYPNGSRFVDRKLIHFDPRSITC